MISSTNSVTSLRGRGSTASESLAIIGPVTFALVDITKALRRVEAVAGTGGSSDAYVSEIVDRIYSLAESMKGSVHSFLGDGVQLTWNATRRVVQHEAKAVRFLVRIGSDMSGAAHTGFARCQLAGTRQQSIVLQERWQPIVRTAFVLACRFGTNLVTGSTFETSAQVQFEARCVMCLVDDAVEEATSSKEKQVQLYEVTSERVGIEEWMYTVAAQTEERRANDLVTSSLVLAMRGQYEEAMGVLDRLRMEESDSSNHSGGRTMQAPSVQHLREVLVQHLIADFENEGRIFGVRSTK